ncbi:hypothetical protein [Psychrobacter sp. DM4]|uniref:hypothetical protein n=1 Tax=Psychrobacter sp. DM4 TaxID=3440637 RepID=UPI003F50D0A2
MVASFNNLNENSPKKQGIEVVNTTSIITPKIYQDIYHQITGRTEKISKTYDDNLLVSFEEVKQLHIKILQIKDIHEILAQNETITIFYAGDRKEIFTSFARFEKYNSSNTKPTVSLILKYNFSLLLAGTSAPQEYVITIKLSSRLSIIESLEEKKPRFIPQGLINAFTSDTAEINVEYVDYLVASTYLHSFDEWITGCPTNPSNKILIRAQSLSHYIPRIIQLAIIIVCVFYYDIYIGTLPDYFNRDWGQFFLYSLVAFFILIKLAFMIGRKIERYLDSFQQDSYLDLNKGDSKLIANSSYKRRKTYLKIFFQLCLTVILGIISSKVSILF